MEIRQTFYGRTGGGESLTELPLIPVPPAREKEPGVVVLGRFQPFHCGHALMVEAAENWRRQNLPSSKLIIAIGSSNRPQSMTNPWSWEERAEMIQIWLNSAGIDSAVIIAIPDIDDPPNWVEHASQYHGRAGVFFTSDVDSANLYETAGWQVELTTLEAREQYEGWRVRGTAMMMSTVTDPDAILMVLSPSIPVPVVRHLIELDGLRRLAFLGEGGEPVG